MPLIDLEHLKSYRNQTFNLIPGKRLASPDEALHYVKQRGFIFFWPIKGIDLPSLWVAAAGDRPVPDEHDDPGHVTWGWKDTLLDKRAWYYARLLRRRNTIVALEFAPYFYALSPNYGAPDQDYIEQYNQGLLTLEAKQIYEALLLHGPLHTIALRKAARLSNPESETRFNRALDTLQIEMKVLPVGIAQAGAWRYAFIYDLVSNHFPRLLEQARVIPETEARVYLIQQYFSSVGAARAEKIQQLFGWRSEDTQRAISKLIASGSILDNLQLPSDLQTGKKQGTWLALPGLVQYDRDRSKIG